MNEHGYTKALIKRLRDEGAVVFKIRGGNGQRVGIPDLYVAHHHYHGWIEVKYKSRKTTPAQQQVMRELAATGTPALVVRGPDHAVERPDGTRLLTLPHRGEGVAMAPSQAWAMP